MAFEAPSPLNYLLKIPDPAESIQKSLLTGMQIGQAQQTAQAAQDAHLAAQQDLQAKTLQAQQQQTEMANMQAFRQRFAENAANPTAGGNLALMREFPQYVAQITGASKAISAEQAKQLQSIHSADLSGAHDVADQEIQKLATSYLNSKDPQDQAYGKSLMGGRKLHDANPGAYANIMGVKIADGIGGEEYQKLYGGVTKLPAEILSANSDAAIKALDAKYEEQKLKDAHATALAAANASNSTTAEKKQAIDQGQKLFEFKKQTEEANATKALAEAAKAKRDAGALSETGSKQYEDARKTVESAGPVITKAMTLANKIRTDGLSGVVADANKYWHRFTGSPDESARLNQQFSAITSSSVLGDMSALGRITPAEIELFSKGVPTENQSGEDKAMWLETYAKVMAFKRDQALEKTKYIAANGDLTPAKRDINIDGKVYKAGSPPPGLEAPATPPPGPVRQAQIQRAQAHLSTLDPKSPEAIKLSAKLKSMGA